jgi:RNA polymerase sigma-70 factor (ECF subfamily)
MTADEELMREWLQGSAGALEALVRRYHAPLLAHLTRLTGQPELAEDLAQEVFLRLVRDGRSYQYPRPFVPWLYAIARHLAMNHYQSAYHRHVALGAEMPMAVATAPNPMEWLERRERREGLRSALSALSFEQREVLSLRFGQELSVEETSAVLGIPVGTVKCRTFTALRRLRESLAREEAPSDERREYGHG